MYQYIDELRKKSERTRKRFAVGFSLAVVAFIFLVWLVTFPGRYRSLTAQNIIQDEPSPLGSIVETIRGGVSDIRKTFQSNPLPSQVAATLGLGTSTNTSSPEYGKVIITDPE